MSSTIALARPSTHTVFRKPRVFYAVPMGTVADDADLMQAYAGGDVAAFEKLYARHKDSIYRYMLQKCREPSLAEDLCQDVWGKLIKSRHRYVVSAQFKTYLYRIAHNCFIDMVRAQKRRPTQSIDQEDETVLQSDDPGPDELLERDRAHARFRDALMTLPADQLDAFLLHEEAGLTLQAIAEVTGVNRETVKSRLRYAARKLKAALEDHPAVSLGVVS